MSGKRWLAALFCLMIAMLLLVSFLYKAEQPTDESGTANAGSSVNSSSSTMGRDRLAEQTIAGASPLESVQQTLTWNDIDQTLASANLDISLRNALLNAIPDAVNPAFLYLGALLQLSVGDAEGSLQTLQRISPDNIPVRYLYAPYRLHANLRSNAENPWRRPMQIVVSQGGVPSIIAARFYAQEGQLTDAFRAYVATDPAEWKNHDIGLLGRLRQHSGFAPDVLVVLRNALAGQRLQASVATAVQQLIDDSGAQQELAVSVQRLVAAARNPSPERDMLLATIERQLEIRKSFAEREYESLLSSCRQTLPVELPTETVYLLVLSAAQTRRVNDFDTWSLELQRRISGSEIRPWLNNIRRQIQ